MLTQDSRSANFCGSSPTPLPRFRAEGDLALALFAVPFSVLFGVAGPVGAPPVERDSRRLIPGNVLTLPSCTPVQKLFFLASGVYGGKD